jgi:UTP-glucose-1-phosphate uridylyltransferase
LEDLQGVAGFPVVDAAAKFEMEEEKEKSKFDQQPTKLLIVKSFLFTDDIFRNINSTKVKQHLSG